jgi:hypothetical protein
VPIVFKFGSLNLLQPSGPVKAYNGIALSLLYKVRVYENRVVRGIIIHKGKKECGGWTKLRD